MSADRGVADVLRDLTRSKAIFQQRAIIAHMGVPADVLRCKSCGKPICGCPDAAYIGVMPGRRA